MLNFDIPPQEPVKKEGPDIENPDIPFVRFPVEAIKRMKEKEGLTDAEILQRARDAARDIMLANEEKDKKRRRA
ncbi:MAG: hypothetical protein WAV25_02620 [Minisyncoccia bacterium]